MINKRVNIGIFLVLILIYSLGIFIRTESFTIRGHSNSHLFTIESAQHYYHTSLVAQGKGIPKVDKLLAWPEGFDTRTDTNLEEYVVGTLYRILPLKHIPLSLFIRYFVRSWYCLTIFIVYFLLFASTKSRVSGIIGASFYALALPAIERSLGNHIQREQFALVIIFLHVYFFYKFLQSGRGRDILASSLLLFLGLVSWKLAQFYYLVLFGYIFLTYLFANRYRLTMQAPLEISRRRRLPCPWQGSLTGQALGFFTAINFIGSLALPTNLRTDYFIFSLPMLLSYSLLASWGWREWRGKKVESLFLFFIIAIGLFFLFPKTGQYNHVWQTMLYKIRYLGVKPLDPSLLSFEARHYWTPPYSSPGLFRFLNEFLILILLASYPVFTFLKRLFQKKIALENSFLLYALFAFFGCYLLFYKLKTFFIFFLVVFIASLFILTKRRVSRVLVLLLLLIGLSFQIYQALSWQNSFLVKGMLKVGIRPLEFPPSGNMLAIGEVLYWIRENTGPQDAFLVPLSLSPQIAAYSQRPTVLHCYFETGIRETYREYCQALFQREEDLADFCKRYKVDYLIYRGDQLLRTDPLMSYRYVANRMDLDEDWAAYRLHFTPEKLENFTLVYENYFYRIYYPGKGKGISREYHPLFDERIFKELGMRTDVFYRRVMEGYDYYFQALVLLQKGKENEAKEALLASQKYCPYIPEVGTLLERLK